MSSQHSDTPLLLLSSVGPNLLSSTSVNLSIVFSESNSSFPSSSFPSSYLPNPLCPVSLFDDSSVEPPVKTPYMYLVFELIVAVIAIIGNTLTIWVFVKNRKLRRLTNYYIVSLAAADLLVGVLGIPFAILTALGMPEAQGPCLSMLCTLILLCTISIFSLVGVSVDRYWAILHPLIYARLMTASRVRREYTYSIILTIKLSWRYLIHVFHLFCIKLFSPSENMFSYILDVFIYLCIIRSI